MTKANQTLSLLEEYPKIQNSLHEISEILISIANTEWLNTPRQNTEALIKKYLKIPLLFVSKKAKAQKNYL